jgi:hypothetical protein
LKELLLCADVGRYQGAYFYAPMKEFKGGMSMRSTCFGHCAAAFVFVMPAFASSPGWAAWEPVRPVEIIVPAGTGGGADQMARTIQGHRHQIQFDEAANGGD